MLIIEQMQRQFLTYRLQDTDADTCLEVVPERGGILTSWRLQGQELLYLDAERFAQPQQSVRGGVPILFPICGNLPENTYHHEGQAFTLKQHGFARDLPWQFEAAASEAEPRSLVVSLASSDETRSRYPFDFALTLTYRLQGATLTIEARVTNHSPGSMPLSLGLHPYFYVADKSQLVFDLPADTLQDQKTGASRPFPGQFDWSQAEIDVIFRQLHGTQATVTDRDRQIRLTFNAPSPYHNLVFWTVRGKDYYCLEPWTAPRNALNTGDQLLHLDPGATLTTTFTITAAFW